MRNRDEALTAVQDHLAHAVARPDDRSILAPAASEDAERLAAAADPGADLEVAHVLGYFHWFRYLDLPENEGREDLAAALRLLALVFRSNPAAVPDQLHRVFLEAGDRDPNADPGALTQRAMSFMTAFRTTGEQDSLDKAVVLFRAAVDTTSAEDPDRATCLNNLGLALQDVFEATGREAALAEAVQAGRGAVDATPADHPDRSSRLSNLAGALQILFERDGDEAVLVEAVALHRSAVNASSPDHPDHAGVLSNLGLALRVLSERTGQEAELIEAVALLRAAVAATSADDHERGSRLTGLAGGVKALFDRTGRRDALTEFVALSRAALDATPPGHPRRAGYLSNLEIALRALFEWTGQGAVLTEAIEVGRAALDATPMDDPALPGRLNNLGLALRILFEHTGQESAVAEAALLLRSALAGASPGDPDRAVYLSTLGGVLQSLFERVGQESALIEAVDVGHASVEATAPGDPRLAGRLNNLGLALRTLFEHTGREDALTEAVQVGRGAVEATPDGHRHRGPHLSNLGLSLQKLFERTGQEDTLAEAIGVGRAAVAATAAGTPDRARYLSNLGVALKTLLERTGRQDTLAESIACFTESAQNVNALAAVRIGAFSALAELPDRDGAQPSDALAAMEAAVSLLPQIVPHALARADREYGLGRLVPLAAQAAAAALDAGRPDRAVELLEQTRGILVSNALDARSSDVARLRHHFPELADRFDELHARIEVAGHASTSPPDGANAGDTEVDRTTALRQAHADWDEFVADIRAVESFENFLEAPGIGELATHAGRGPIVFVTTSPRRCDALILTDDLETPVRTVQLTSLTEAEAHRQTGRLLDAERAARDSATDPMIRIAAQAEILEILAWLWDRLAEPVLDALGYTTTPAVDEPWPRVWWCPVGILSYLPLHAAGHHAADPAGDRQPRTVLDRVVSSYTTTVRALAYSRARPHAAATTTLIVAVPDAPNVSFLSGVTTEAKLLADLVPGAQILPHPTKDSVLASLAHYAVAHFACHGHVDWADPAASRLVLHDHETAPLTIADISALRLDGGLAFLSACDTHVTNPALTNEGVHITGAFHLAGYSHVIGTLWRVDDTAARDLAADFYSGLIDTPTAPPEVDLAPQALHFATRRLRDRYPLTPTLWAAHTHTGA